MHDNRRFQEDVTRNIRLLRREIGGNIHQHRLEQGMTLKKLSKLSGLSAARIDYLEMGKTEMDLHHLVSLAMGLRVSVRDLLVAGSLK